MDTKVYCQIMSRWIASNSCVSLQQSHDAAECFGCGACSRLCAKCRKRSPVSPEIGLCCHCIGDQLDIEQQFRKKNFKRSRVGDSIGLCSQCTKREVYYSEYGLCLTCALEKYASVWLMVGVADLKQLADLICDKKDKGISLLERARTCVITHQLASVPFIQSKMGVSKAKADALLRLLELEKVVGSVRKRYAREVLVQLDRCQAAELDFYDLVRGVCIRCKTNEEEIRCNHRPYCVACARQEFGSRWTLSLRRSVYRSRIIAGLLAEARHVAQQKTSLTNRALREELVIGEGISARLIHTLQEEGVLGTYSAKISGHPVLNSSKVALDEGKHPTRRKFSQRKRKVSSMGDFPNTCSKCERPANCIRVRGTLMCIQCARTFYPSDWTRNLGQSPHRKGLMQELYGELLASLAQCEVVSVFSIQRQLCVGRNVAERLFARLQQSGILGEHVTLVVKGARVLQERLIKLLQPDDS